MRLERSWFHDLYLFVAVIIAAAVLAIFIDEAAHSLGVSNLILGFGWIVGVVGTAVLLIFPTFGTYLAIALITIEVGLVRVASYGIYLYQPVVMITATGILARSLLRNGRVFWPHKLWPVLLLWVVYTASILVAIDVEVTLGGVAFFVPLLTFCWLIAVEGRSPKTLNRIIAVTLWIGTATALIGIMQVFGQWLGVDLVFSQAQEHFMVTYGRPSGLQSEPNWFGIYIGMIMGMALPLWIRRQHFKHLRVNLPMLCILGLAVLISGTRSVWVALLTSVVLVTFVNLRMLKGKLFRVATLILLLIISAIIVTVAIPQTRDTLSRLSRILNASDQTSQTRINTWLEAWQYIRARPVQGYGLSAWETISPIYNQQESALPRIIDGKSVPNIFLETWLSAGLSGLIVMIWLIAYYSYHLVRFSRQKKDPWRSILAEALLSGWIVVVVASFFTNAFKHNWFWIIVGLINALVAIPTSSEGYELDEYSDG